MESDDCIVLKIPRSIKGRWIAASRKAGSGKLVPWLVDQINSGTLDNYQPMDSFANAVDEPRATVVINCTKAFKVSLQERARALEDCVESLTDMMVNLIESNRDSW